MAGLPHLLLRKEGSRSVCACVCPHHKKVKRERGPNNRISLIAKDVFTEAREHRKKGG